MSISLFVNIAAPNIARALVRSEVDLSPVAFPNLVLGDAKTYKLYLVDGLGGFASFSGSGAYIPYIALGSCGYPDAGLWTATFTTATTTDLAVNAAPAAVQAALEALASIGVGNVLVSGVAGKYYKVTFVGALADTDVDEITCNFDRLTPAATIEVSTLQVGGGGFDEIQLLSFALNPISFADNWTPITNGWTGDLSTRTLKILQAFVTAGTTLNTTFQVTVADPLGLPTTYLKAPATIQCTTINPESFAGADKPLLATQAALNAAVLGANNFTREEVICSGAGNYDITRPATARHHIARVAVSGAISTRTLSLLTTGSPSPGDTILLVILTDPSSGGISLEVRNNDSGGTVLEILQTNDAQTPYLVICGWNGSEWELEYSTFGLLAKSANLEGLGNTLTSKANLRTLFASLATSQIIDFTITTDEDGVLWPVDATAGNVIATLPNAATAGAGFMIALQKVDGSSNLIQTDPAFVNLTYAGQLVVFISDGGNWFVLFQSSGSVLINEAIESTNNSGDTTVTCVAPNHVEKVEVGGSARTSVIILGVSAVPAGAAAKIRVEMPSTAGIVIEIRNSDNAGDLLWTINSTTEALNYYCEAYWNGVTWKRLFNVAPVE